MDFDPFSEAYFDDPFPIYRQLRDEAPDLYVERWDCFFLSRFEDIWQAVSNPAFSHQRGTTSMELLLGAQRHQRALSSMVPPEHTALRKSLVPSFTPRAAAALEARTRMLVAGFLDEMPRDAPLDVNQDLAMRISARVAFMLIGLPLDDADVVAGKVNQSFDRTKGKQGTTEAGSRAIGDLHQYLREAIEERRTAARRDDLLDRLLHFEWQEKPLPDEELLSNLYLLVVGGTETLPKVFSGAVYQLWRHPEQRAEVAAEPALATDAFWEALRYEMPTLMLGASADVDTEIGGERCVKVRAGQKLMHLWCSANRDEREFDEPERFDIHRRAPRILTFNHARHRCLGAHIAQMEGRVLLQELLARAPHYEVDEAKAVRIRSEFFRGFSSLPIELGRRAN